MHRGPFGNCLDCESDLSVASDREMLAMDAARSRPEKKVNAMIVFVFIVELLVLVLAAVLEYFLRFTDVFPVHKLGFSCRDVTISLSTNQGRQGYASFAYNAEVSYKIIYSICFCVPPLTILVSELAVWAFSSEPQKTVRAMCHECPMPQISRRIIRYIGLFLFGMLVTLIITDVCKLMTGCLRPTFIELCRFNETCLNERIYGDNACAQPDRMKLRDARLSFPSIHASMTSFAATYLAIYLHGVMENTGFRVLRPFFTLSLLLLSLICSLARYRLNYSHWADILTGFALGIVVAAYVGAYVLNNFHERINSHKLYVKLKHFLAEQRTMELRDYYKENWDRLERQGYLSSSSPGSADAYLAHNLAIPRPRVHINEHAVELNGASRTKDRAQGRQYQGHNTFQRDLQRTVDDFRGHSTSPGYGHM